MAPPESRASHGSRTRNLANDWLPPVALRAARRARRARTGGAEASTPPRPVEPEAIRSEAALAIPRFEALTARTLDELASCPDVYRPTRFWGPGLTQLLSDMAEQGLPAFQRWQSAGFWFLPQYGNGFTDTTIRMVFNRAVKVNPRVRRRWLRSALDGSTEARRDFDALRLAWDQGRWPMDLESHGASRVGDPPQEYRLVEGSEARFSKPFLNYLLCLAALSQHVEEAPRSFLEIGGGYGALGEIVLSRDATARYVNLDIPPLVTVSSYYLTELFGDERILTYGDQVPSSGRIEVPRSACLPNFRISDIGGPFDVFVNTYSFQEMEPDVVEHYIDAVCRAGVQYVVSLNSKHGKPKVADGHEIGVVDPVTSDLIVKLFEQRGYAVCATYGRPLIVSAGELAVLRRRS